MDASNPDHVCERVPLGLIHPEEDQIWYFVAPRGAVQVTSMVDDVIIPHDTTGPSGAVQQFAPDQWPTTLPCNANTPMKYFLPDDSPLNVVLVVEVVFSVWGLPATANWIFAEYFVAPVTEFHENTIDVDVADSHVNPVGAGSGSEAPHTDPGGHPAAGNPKPPGT